MNQSKRRIRIIIETAIAAIVLAFCEWFFFRNIIGTDVGSMIGDRGDGRLTMLLTEHWWSFFNGREKFSEIAMFYPAQEVFGYTDLFLGYGLFYSIFRLIGMNMFRAYRWTIYSVSVMGTASMYYLMKRKLNCNLLWSLFGTIAFCFSNTYAVHIIHTQLAAISYLPILLIFLLGFIRNYHVRYKRNIYAYCSVVWFVLLTYNSWYIACFSGIFGLICLVVYAICLKAEHAKVWSVLGAKIKLAWMDIICYVIAMIVLYIPFIRIYVPVLRSSSGYTYEACATFLPEFVDIINVTEGNWMLGWLVKQLRLSERGYTGEVAVGFSIILLALFLVMSLVNRKQCKKKYSDGHHIADGNWYGMIMHRSICISVIVGILLIIRLSANGASLWWFVYTLIPVAKSVRAVARFMFWLSFPMAVITAYTANKYISTKRIGSYVIQVLLVVLIFASNINKVGVGSSWNVREELNFITNVAQPPEDVESFYIIDSAMSCKENYIYQIDAFEIASWYGIKTINGYSGQFPPEWGGIWSPCSAGYEDAVRSWIERYELEHVYAYDCATNTWVSIITE